MIKEGDIVTPKDHPEFKSKVKKIIPNWDEDFHNEPFYILENGCRYTKEELQ